MQQPTSDLTRSIRDLDQYIGQMAKAEVYIDGEDAKQTQAVDQLLDLTKKFPARIEAYLKLWAIYYTEGNFYLKKSQNTSVSPTKDKQVNIAREAQAQQDERLAQENFIKAVDMAEKLLKFCTDITETNEKL